MTDKMHKGFTLIEIMITVAVIGMLATIAVTQYDRYEKTAIRSDAISGLSIALNDMEKCAAGKGGSYTACTLTSRSIVNGQTPRGRYNLNVAISAGGTGFDITASRVAGEDPQCQVAPKINYMLVINNLGQHGIQVPGNLPQFEQGNTPQMIEQIRECWNK